MQSENRRNNGIRHVYHIISHEYVLGDGLLGKNLVITPQKSKSP